MQVYISTVIAVYKLADHLNPNQLNPQSFEPDHLNPHINVQIIQKKFLKIRIRHILTTYKMGSVSRNFFIMEQI